MGRKTKAERKKVYTNELSEQTEETSADRSYYYDDAHGYEEFDPEKDHDDEECDD